jgi:SecD/SecF fusion protein
LEFFETYSLSEIQTAWLNACEYVKANDTAVRYQNLTLRQLQKRGLHKMVYQDGSHIFGFVAAKNRQSVDSMLRIPGVKALFPNDLNFMFSEKEESMNGERNYILYAVKIPPTNKAIISGKDIKEASVSVDEENAIISVMLTMKDDGAIKWANMTGRNVGKTIAMVVDGQVISSPIVQTAITDGKTQISGNFTLDEANLLAARINAGK